MSSPRLPIPGSDDGAWGDLLNEYLRVAHAEDGNLKANSISAVQLRAGSVTAPALADGSVGESKLTQGVRDKLDALVSVTDGREIELRNSTGFIQWRYVGGGEDDWTNLVALADLKGDKGDTGEQGPQGEQGIAGLQGLQ